MIDSKILYMDFISAYNFKFLINRNITDNVLNYFLLERRGIVVWYT